MNKVKVFDKLTNLLGAPIENISQSFYDSYVEQNIKFRATIGLKETIIRRQIGKCCDWCANLAGIYDASDAPEDIYRRHENCRCMVTHKSEKGKYTDVWSKKEYQTQKEARKGREKEILSEQNKKINNSKKYEEKILSDNSKNGKIFIEIDELTPCLRDNKTGELLSTNVTTIETKDLKSYNKKNGWYINWAKMSRECEIKALRIDGSDEIQGLVAFEDHKEDQWLEGKWAVANPKSQGINIKKGIIDQKEYDGIGGHLFAVMVHESLKRGYNGEFKGTAANNDLLRNYIEKLGAEHLRLMDFIVSGKASQNLLRTYQWENK